MMSNKLQQTVRFVLFWIAIGVAVGTGAAVRCKSPDRWDCSAPTKNEVLECVKNGGRR